MRIAETEQLRRKLSPLVVAVREQAEVPCQRLPEEVINNFVSDFQLLIFSCGRLGIYSCENK